MGCKEFKLIFVISQFLKGLILLIRELCYFFSFLLLALALTCAVFLKLINLYLDYFVENERAV